MPLVEANSLPAYTALRREGLALISSAAAGRERPLLHVGLLNLMPDAALRATDRQFLRLLDAYGSEADIHVHPFTLAAEARGAEAQDHVDNWYTSFATLRQRPLDALVITGANPRYEHLADEAFWPGLVEVIDWAAGNIPSVLCSCLATHAVIQHLFNEVRVRLPAKMWGVFDHTIRDAQHPLLSGIREPVSAPHSHYFDLSARRMEAIGVKVLMHSATGGVHMATVTQGTEWVFFQGHPEYDRVSLMKEFKREISRHASGERDYPPLPQNYFPESCRSTLEQFGLQVKAALAKGTPLPALPEDALLPHLSNSWVQPGRQIFFNWLQRVSKR